MIAGLRGLGLPAAYVSGYLRTIPPPGKPRLEGADATHAWVSVWCGAEIGWLGLDPTNAIDAGNDHIVLAIGRDFSDVSPIYGVFVGSGAQELEVGVDVLPVQAGGLGRFRAAWRSKWRVRRAMSLARLRSLVRSSRVYGTDRNLNFALFHKKLRMRRNTGRGSEVDASEP